MTKKAEKGRKGRSIQVPAGAVYALLAAMSLICVTVLALVIADMGGEEEKEEIEPAPRTLVPHLFIEDVFFRGLEGSPMRVELTVYMTNDGTKDAESVRVDAWPVMTESNMAKDGASRDVGTVGVNRTASPTMTVFLEPATTHSVELLIFERGKVVLRGRSTVSTSGVGGSDYQNIEVRGTGDDSDYDGIPDDWELYYCLDPNDPRDANEDTDGDGVKNIDEYRLMTDPVDDSGGGGTGEEEKDSSILPEPPFSLGVNDSDESVAAFGAALFLLMFIGVIAILVGSAAWAHRRSEKREQERREKASFHGASGLNPSRTIEDGRQCPPEVKIPGIDGTSEESKVESQASDHGTYIEYEVMNEEE